MDLHYLFSTVFDCLFPPHGEALLVQNFSKQDVSKLYTPKYYESIHVLSEYRNKNIQALIHEAKFHHNIKAWTHLHSLFALHFQKISEPIDYIIPIPLSPARMRARGYNQVSGILKAHPTESAYPILENILVRTRHTKPQTELKRNERLTNMHDAFSVVHSGRITGKNILLVDDVTTTGSTLKAAKATLEKYNIASITCIAIAH
ncbi:MAG: phosphoribosyltransferase family protein [Minisyncoccia bacterium]